MGMSIMYICTLSATVIDGRGKSIVLAPFIPSLSSYSFYVTDLSVNTIRNGYEFPRCVIWFNHSEKRSKVHNTNRRVSCSEFITTPTPSNFNMNQLKHTNQAVINVDESPSETGTLSNGSHFHSFQSAAASSGATILSRYEAQKEIQQILRNDKASFHLASGMLYERIYIIIMIYCSIYIRQRPLAGHFASTARLEVVHSIKQFKNMIQAVEHPRSSGTSEHTTKPVIKGYWSALLESLLKLRSVQPLYLLAFRNSAHSVLQKGRVWNDL